MIWKHLVIYNCDIMRYYYFCYSVGSRPDFPFLNFCWMIYIFFFTKPPSTGWNKGLQHPNCLMWGRSCSTLLDRWQRMQYINFIQHDICFILVWVMIKSGNVIYLIPQLNTSQPGKKNHPYRLRFLTRRGWGRGHLILSYPKELPKLNGEIQDHSLCWGLKKFSGIL